MWLAGGGIKPGMTYGATDELGYYAAENPVRDFFVGEMAKLHSSFAQNAPRLYDTMQERQIDSAQNSGEPSVINRHDGLYKPNSRLQERGSSDRFVLETSVYQKARMHPLLTAGLIAGGSIALAAAVSSRMTRTSRGENMYRPDDGRNELPRADVIKGPESTDDVRFDAGGI